MSGIWYFEKDGQWSPYTKQHIIDLLEDSFHQKSDSAKVTKKHMVHFLKKKALKKIFKKSELDNFYGVVAVQRRMKGESSERLVKRVTNTFSGLNFYVKLAEKKTVKVVEAICFDIFLV